MIQTLACGAYGWFQRALIRLCVCAAAALFAVLILRTQTVRDAAARIAALWRETSYWMRLVAMSLVFGFVIHAGTKTNSPPLGMMMPLQPPLPQSVVQQITEQEIAQGWRLESVTTNDAVSYAMPTNGVEYGPWSRGGGRAAHFALDLGGFGFPFGTGVVRRLDVLSGGMAESLPRQRVDGAYRSPMSICAAREYASVVPGVGRFWWAEAACTRDACPYREILLTWEGVFAGRDRTGQYNAQIELCGDGNFITRSNDVERAYRRVLPYDWDNDGLPNDIDPAPEVPLVPSAWNQGGAWAAAAFPSNAAEIASAGGYAAWAASRAADPDRRLVSLGVAFDDGSAWPALLDFGGVPVMADGAEGLAFAIDCGARVPFTLTAGRLASVDVASSPTRLAGSSPTRGLFPLLDAYPCERMVGDVTVHLDGPRSGWICRVAGVDVGGAFPPHLFPGDFVELSATVSTCHSNAYFGCTWHGGAGIEFSEPHSLTTAVTYDPASSVDWATNGIELVTRFAGYSLTNRVSFTVGVYEEPRLQFSLGCQEVFFLNDADFLDGECPSNRPERIRPVTLNLSGPLGTNGTARLSVQGSAEPVVFHVADGVTNRVTSETEFPLAVTDACGHSTNCTVYVSCPKLGTGTVAATFTPAGGGETLTDSVTFRCIEPLRKLVTAEKADGRYVNPSRLVMGTNAVLKVGVNGPFSPSEVDWRVVSGPARIVATNGWCATVEPTGMGTATVEARFNGDEIQPRFVLPVVMPRTIPVRAFVVEPPIHLIEVAWEDDKILSHIDKANEIFSQIGVLFQLDGILHDVGNSNDWDLCIYEERNYDTKWETLQIEEYTEQFEQLAGVYTNRDCVKIFYLGSVRQSAQSQSEDIFAEWKSEGIFIPKGMPVESLAHELGHALRLFDIYQDNLHSEFGEPTQIVELAERKAPLEKRFWGDTAQDWGYESGRGFYELSDTLGMVLRKFLMYGVYEDINNIGCDIPADTVWGLPANATEQGNARLIAIGARQTELHGSEVYSR